MSEWVTIQLKELLTLKRGYDLPHSETKSGPYPVVASTNVRGYHNEYKVDGPVITVGRSGSIGHVQYIESKAWPLNTTLYMTDAKGNNKRFIYYFLKTIGLEQFNSGAGVPTLNRNHINLLKVKIPKNTIQTKIADVLSTYDKLIENNNRRIQILEQTAEELYKEWFVRMRFPGYEKTKFDKGIPEGWRIENIKNTVPVLTGKKDANYADENGQYMFFTCSQEPSRSKGYSFDSHSILLAGNGDFNVKLYKGKFEAYQRTYVLTPYNHCHLYLIYFKLKNDIERLISQAAGSVIRYLTKGMIERINFFVPNELLLNEFNKYVEDIYRASDLIIKQNENLIKQRDLLLPRLMNGTITIK